MVQPKVEIDLQFETTRSSNRIGYITATLLGVTTFGTIAIMSGFFLTPDATFDDYVSRVLPSSPAISPCLESSLKSTVDQKALIAWVPSHVF